MPNRITRGIALIGNLKAQKATFSTDAVKVATGKLVHLATATVATTDTTAKTLFTLPAHAVITAIRLSSATGSDAGTTATVSVGKGGGTGAEYLNGQSVKAAGTIGQLEPTTLATLGDVGSSAVTVTATYAETGTASTTGGPWTVIVEYTTTDG